MLPSGWEVTTAVILAIVSFPVSLVLTRFFMQVNSKRGIVGIDVHKLSKPRIPEMCGAAIPVTLILLSSNCSPWIGLPQSSVQSDTSSTNLRELPPPHHLSTEHTGRHLCYLKHDQHARPAKRHDGRRRLNNIRGTPHRSPHHRPHAKHSLPIRLPTLLGARFLLLQQIPVKSVFRKCGTIVHRCSSRRPGDTWKDRDCEHRGHVPSDPELLLLSLKNQEIH